MEYEQPTYTIWARNSDGNTSAGSYTRIDQVQDWQTLNVDLKWSDSSTFSLALPTAEFIKRWDVTLPAETLISDGFGLRGILIFRNGGSWPGIDDNGNLVLSGVVTDAKRDWNGSNDVITLTGEQDTYYLKTRQEYPYYATYYDSTHYWWGDGVNKYWNSGYNNTAIESIIRAFAYWTMGAGTPGSMYVRRLNNFSSGVDNARGDTVSYFTRFESIFSLAQNLIKMHTSDTTYFGFDVIQISDTSSVRLLLRFMAPRDMSAGAVFGTDLGNISHYTYEERAPEYNYLVVSGPKWDGSATSSSDYDTMYCRTTNLDSLGKYGRIEGLETYSGSDSTSPTTAKIEGDLCNQGNKFIKEKAVNQAATIELSPNQSAEFMSSFQLGDLVTTAIGGQQWVDYIREIKIDVDHEKGETVTPTTCDPWKFYWSGGATHRLSRDNARQLKNIQRGF